MELQETPQKTERAERRQADQPSTLREQGSSAPQDSWVHDVSRTGMRIESRATLSVGDEITVGLAGAGATRAHVVWKRGNEYGCQFDEPLGPEDAAQAFHGSPVVALHQFGQRAVTPLPMDDRTAEMLSLIDDQPAHGRLWMAALAAALIATAVPLSMLLTRLF